MTAARNLHEERGYRDATSGALAADARHVYAVRNQDLPKLILRPGFDGRIIGGVNHSRRSRVNRLVAYDRRTGRTVWSAGGRDFLQAVAAGTDPQTADTFFCGPPLPTPHGLAVIAETGGLLRLLILDPDDGTLRRSMPIAVPPLPLYEPPRWRVGGLGVSAAAGLWIVPTAAGGVAAIDPLTGSFDWTYRYTPSVRVEDGPLVPRRAPLSASEDDQTGWADIPPQIVAGRVLLTPRDSEQLHCLDLHTGQPLWVRPRGAGRQIAGVAAGDGSAGDGWAGDGANPAAATALLVGDDGVRGLSLADGTERWFTPLPPASGDATYAGGTLMVPLSDDTLATLRPEDGELLNRLPAGGRIGNLIAAGGRLISQTPADVTAFRTRTETAASIEAAFVEGADAATVSAALLLRAGFALQEGRDADAVADLIVAAAPPAAVGGSGVAARAAAGEALDRLSEVLAEGLRRDFGTFAPLLKNAKGVLGDPPSGEVARAFADGLAAAGRRREAFRVLAGAEDDLSGPAVTAAAWARGRLGPLFAEANADDRIAMAAEVRERHAAAGADGAALEAFAQRFGRLCASAAWRSANPPPDGAVDLADEALRRAATRAADGLRGSPLAKARLLRWAAGRPGAAPVDAALAALYEAAGDPVAAAHHRNEPPTDPAAGRGVSVAEALDRGRVPPTQRLPVGSTPPWARGGRLTWDNDGPHLHWQADDGRVRFSHVFAGATPRRGARGLWDGHLLVVGLGNRALALDTLAASQRRHAAVAGGADGGLRRLVRSDRTGLRRRHGPRVGVRRPGGALAPSTCAAERLHAARQAPADRRPAVATGRRAAAGPGDRGRPGRPPAAAVRRDRNRAVGRRRSGTGRRRSPPRPQPLVGAGD